MAAATELRHILVEFYSDSGQSLQAQQHKRALEGRLLGFQALENSHVISCEVLAEAAARSTPGDDFLLYFCGSVLEDVVQKRWERLAAGDRHRIRAQLAEILVRQSDSLPPWVSGKLAKAYASLGRMGWPDSEPTFFSDLEGLAAHGDGSDGDSSSGNGSGRAIGHALLAVAVEELVRDDTPLPSARRARLSEALTAEMPVLLDLLTATVAGAAAGFGSLGRDRNGATAVPYRRALPHALRCMLALVGWAPLGDHLDPRLFAALFGVVGAAVSAVGNSGSGGGDAAELRECAADAVAVVTEVLSKRHVPRRLAEFVAGLATDMLSLLRALTADGGITMGALNERLLEQITEFLGGFLSQHLDRMLRLAADPATASNFPLGDFLHLLTTFTFQQPSAAGLQRCLLPWSSFACFVTAHGHDGDGGGGNNPGLVLARQHAQGLGGLCQTLMSRILFVTNAEVLSELDDEGGVEGGVGSGNGGSGGGEGGSSSGWGTDAETDACADGGGGSAAADGGSQLDEFLLEATDLLLTLAQLPPLGDRIAAHTIDLFSRILQELGAVLSAGSDAGGGVQASRAARLACDAATLSRLMPAAAAGGGASDVFLGAAAAAADAAQALLSAGLHFRGATFVRLEVAILGALRTLAPGIAAAAAAGATERAAKLLDAIVGIVRTAWASPPPTGHPGAAATPAAVQRAAGQLHCTLPMRLPPDLLAGSAAMLRLLQDAEIVATGLPAPARVLLYRGLAAFLLPPPLMRGAGSLAQTTDFDARAAAYMALVKPLLPPLLESAAAAAGGDGGGSGAGGHGLDLAGIEASCRVLAVLCCSVTAAPTRLKQLCHEALRPALPAAVSLLGPCLRAARADAMATAAAGAVVQLLVAAAASLMAQLGSGFASSAVLALVSLFPRAGQAAGGGGGGAEGLGEGAAPLGREGWRLLGWIYRLLTTILGTRSKATAPLVPQAAQLALDTLTECVGSAEASDAGSAGGGGGGGGFPNSAAVNGDSGAPGSATTGAAALHGHDAIAELYPDFLGLAEQLLTTQWQCFAVLPPKKHVFPGHHHDAVAASPPPHAEAPPEQRARFAGICAVLHSCVAGDGGRVPPEAARCGVALLLRVDEANGLFALPFLLEAGWTYRLTLDCLRALAHRAQPLLAEELAQLAAALGAAAPAAFEEALGALLHEYGGSCNGGGGGGGGLSEERKAALRALWSVPGRRAGGAGIGGTADFGRVLNAFCNDLRYYAYAVG